MDKKVAIGLGIVIVVGAATAVVLASSKKAGAAEGTFTLQTQVSPSGGGQIVVSPQKARYNAGDIVTVNAIPSANYQFDHFVINGQSYSASQINLNIRGNAIVMAVFTLSGTTGQVNVTVVNLPALAGQWACAIQGPDGVWYQPYHSSITNTTFPPGGTAQFSLPQAFVSGLLSIQALEGSSIELSGINIIDMFQLNVNLTPNIVFDFATHQVV